MDELDVIKLYAQERNYQRCIFGEYKDLKFLNVCSLLTFIEEYVERAKKAYTGPWGKATPDWLRSCAEAETNNNTMPVEVYENLIKIMALAGAALENYAEVDPQKWRVKPLLDGEKWLKSKNGGHEE